MYIVANPRINSSVNNNQNTLLHICRKDFVMHFQGITHWLLFFNILWPSLRKQFVPWKQIRRKRTYAIWASWAYLTIMKCILLSAVPYGNNTIWGMTPTILDAIFLNTLSRFPFRYWPMTLSIWWKFMTKITCISLSLINTGGHLNKKDGLTRYGDSHVKDKTS